MDSINIYYEESCRARKLLSDEIFSDSGSSVFSDDEDIPRTQRRRQEQTSRISVLKYSRKTTETDVAGISRGDISSWINGTDNASFLQTETDEAGTSSSIHETDNASFLQKAPRTSGDSTKRSVAINRPKRKSHKSSGLAAKKVEQSKKSKKSETTYRQKVENARLKAIWKNVTAFDAGPAPIPFAPNRIPGPNNVDDLDDNSPEIAYFKKFFTDQIFLDLVQEINRYALQTIEERKELLDDDGKLKPHSTLNNWEEIDVQELHKLIGMVLNMGIVRLPRMKDYWSRDRTVFQTFFRETMPRKRFLLLFQTVLHVSHIDSPNEVIQKHGKIEPLLNKVIKNFQDCFQPYREISADESMIGFKGAICFRQYMPNKPTKFGILARSLADASTGYLLNAYLYYGKSEETTDNLSKTAHAVVKLCKPYFDQGYHVFSDRLYNSLQLANVPYKNKMLLTGTIRVDRKGLPPQVKDKEKKWEKGEFEAFCFKNNMILKWMDKRATTMISSCYRGHLQEEITLRRTKKKVWKPQVIAKYNNFMCGVDIADQLHQYYNFDTRTLKWWRKVFFWLLDTAVVNSYIIYKIRKGAKACSHLQFRKNLIQSLVSLPGTPTPTPTNTSPTTRYPSTLVEMQRLNDKFHFLKKRPGNKSRECLVCSTRHVKKGRHETAFYCGTCVKEPSLCPTTCFQRYHTLV